MKTFLKRITKVLFAFALGVILFVFVIHAIIRMASNFEIQKDAKFVVFGHSHSECAYDDTILENFQNLSSSGENYFYSYHKAKEVIEVNKNLKAVFLEFTNYSTGVKLDSTIWDDKSLDIFFPWHSSFMEKEEYSLLIEKNPKGFLKAIPISTRDNLSRVLTFNFNLNKRYGRFFKYNRTITPAEIENAQNNPKIPYWMKLKGIENRRVENDIFLNSKKLSSYNLKYLLKIIEFCNKKGVQVYLVRSPQHRFYPRINESELSKMKEVYLKDVPFLDFDEFPLRDEEFADTEHLNSQGAKVFSTWFNNLLSNGLLENKNKSEYIYSEIEKLKRDQSL